jgi:type I restriction enzyme, S subunit
MNDRRESGWTTVRIGDILSHRKERARPTDPLLSVTSDRGVVPQAESGRRDISSTNKWAYWRVYPGDIVYNTMRMWQGVSARSYYFGIVSPAYTVCSARPGTDTSFLSYALKLPELIAAFKNRSQGLVSDTWNLKYRSFAEIPISVPVYAEQRRIAKTLDTPDEAIRSTERLIAKLEQAKKGLIHDLLTRGIDESGHLRMSEVLCQVDGHQLPSVWKLWPLEAIAEVSRGQFTHRPRNDPAYYGGEYPFIQTGDIAKSAGGYISNASQSLNELGASVSLMFPAGTIAVTIAANIADTAILSVPMCFPDSVVGVQVKSPHNTRYVELCIRAAKPSLEARAPQSAQKNINLQDLRPLAIPLPGYQEQERIVSAYEAYEKSIESLLGKLTKLRLLKGGLVDDLLTGRVRVVTSA